jgi:glycosyltransferase involved in cell wall biosynthesis
MLIDKNMNTNTVSIVIPCRNEEKYIDTCLRSLTEMCTADFSAEIIIADGESTDNTLAIIATYQKEFSYIKVVNNKQRYTPMGLNLGIRHASGEFILIASAHSSFSKDYLSILLKERERLNADVVGGVMITSVLNSNKKSEAIKEVLSCKFGVGNALFRTGIKSPRQVDTVPFGLYKKTLFEEIGYYDERLIRNHDIEFSKRLIAAGKKIFLVPDAVCSYYARESYHALSKNNFRNGLWNMLTVKISHRFSSLSLRHFIPLLFILSIILPTLLSLVYFPFLFLALASLFLYLCFLTINTERMVIEKKLSFPYIFAAFIVLHISYGTGSLCGIFKSIK